MQKPDLFVVARFLERLHDAERPLKKTELQLQVRVNYTIFQKYIDWLVAHDMVIVGDDVRLAPAGMEAYQRLVSWIRETIELL